MRGRLTVAAPVRKQQTPLGMHCQSVRALGENVLIVLCHAPSSAFGTFSPRKNLGGRRRSTQEASQKGVRNAGLVSRLPTPDLRTSRAA